MRWLITLCLFATLVVEGAGAQAPGRITGSVTGETGAPLQGVQVSVVGTQLGARTGADGRYTITAVPAGRHTLRAERVGHTPRTEQVTVSAGGVAEASFQMALQALSLEGVVAVGYGTQRRKDVTGSVASIDLEDVRSTPVVSVDQVLQGRAPGVQVTQTSGAPGGGVSVRIRGTNSISANSEPLYVVDGVPAFVGSLDRGGGRGHSTNPLADMSPNDIASIEVLKDASATAIYGSRGANGVVLITTKRGRRGENTVQFESSYGMQEAARTIPVLNATQYAEFVNEARANSNMAPLFTAAQIAGFGEGTNWQKEILRSAPVQNHGLTISGGDDKTRYMVTGGFFDQEGIIVNSGFRRYSARLNLDREVSDRFRIGNSLTVSRTGSDIARTDAGLNSNSGTIDAALKFAPTSPIRDSEGRYILTSPVLVPIANPVATALEIINQRTASRLVGNVFGEYDLTDALLLRVSLGGNAFFERENYYAPTIVQQGATVSGDAIATSLQSAEVINENILTYKRTLRDGHDLDLTGGFTTQNFRSEFVTAAAQGFATDVTGPNNLGAGALPRTPGSGTNEWTLLSGLARANYNLLDRYLFTVTGRADGSSKFGTNSKWGYFPSAAFGWRLSEESFLDGADWLDDLKLRASYGLTGNQEIGTFTSLARLTDVAYIIGGRRQIGYAPAGQAPNPDLKWESTRQLDIGFDAAFLGNRLNVTSDFYRSTTNDLLLVVELPRTTGFSSQLRNIGSVRNWGVELGINTVNVERENFTWSTSFNIARSRNEVLDLGGLETIETGTDRVSGAIEGRSATILKLGRPLSSFHGYKVEGIWQVGDDFSKAPPEAAPGEYRFLDVNGDRLINAEDRTILGDANPDFFGGMTNNFVLGPVSLDLFLQGTYGNEVLYMSAVDFKSVSGRSNEHAQALDRWTPQRPSNTIPRANFTRARRVTSAQIEDGSFLRLQNVTLGYQLPDGLLPRVSQARVYASGQNLWLSTKYTGYDPEVSSFGGDPTFRGVEIGGYPRARTVNVGINATF